MKRTAGARLSPALLPEPGRPGGLRWAADAGAFALVRVLVLATVVTAARVAGRDVLAPLTSWDAQWYASIAAHGYGFVRFDQGRMLSDYAFFPLYPAVEAVGAWLLGVSPVVAGLLVSGAAGLVAAAGIGAVARQAGLGDRAATVSVVLWAAVPTGVVESLAFSESLFVACASWALWCALRGHWWWASALAVAAGLTRPQGAAVLVAVVVPALAGGYRDGGDRAGPPGPGRLMGRVGPVVLAVVGGLAYVGWVGVQRRSVTGYLDVARGWGNTFDGGLAFARWVARLLAGESPVGGALCLLGVATLAGLVVALARRRPPPPVLLYVAVLVVMALTTSAYFGSKPRYLLPAFPLLFPVAAWLVQRGRTATVVWLGVLTGCSAAFAAWWLLGPGPL